MTNTKKSHQTSLRFSPEEWQTVQATAAHLHIPVIDMLRALVTEYAKQHQERPNGLRWPPLYVGIAKLESGEVGNELPEGFRLVNLKSKPARSSMKTRGGGLIYPVQEE